MGKASLAVYLKRFYSIAGAAKAARMAGKHDVARERCRQLLDLAKTGDGKRPELAEAKAYVAKS